jgi:hypothetical protein
MPKWSWKTSSNDQTVVFLHNENFTRFLSRRAINGYTDNPQRVKPLGCVRQYGQHAMEKRPYPELHVDSSLHVWWENDILSNFVSAKVIGTLI